MSRKSVIFVDAGFLLATGGLRVTGNSLRSAFSVQYKSLADGIQSFVSERDSRDLLRMYWYDAAKDGVFSDEHKRIGLLPGVKVRLGRMSYNGEQKGVDLKLGLDLVGVARNRSADVAYLLSGDDDLAEAVEAAQDLGMKVVLLGIENQGHRLGVTAVAEHLALQVDDIATLPQSLLDRCFAKSAPVVAAYAAASSETGVEVSVSGNGAGPAPGTRPFPGPGMVPALGAVAAEEGEAAADAEAAAGAGTEAAESPAAAARAAASVAAGPTGPSGRPVPTPGPRRVPQDVRPVPAAGAVRREPVYSTATGAPAAQSPWFDLVESAEAVAVSLADNWHGSVSQRELSELLAERPLLPPTIDRVLIKDCAAKIGEAKTDLQDIRKAIRAAFWRRLDELV
ncbi:NYN domain-containing protein [Arthrobacter oryzae]|uniref:NYN domain-containing protein n=1 Tax=Arthrobacter oryzae TaxID=409290 RepID=UPI00273CE550|nr:NYN domain-containing protein [Arthrobacter oryzae]WLQ07278.1 NYN domain-containing protein [Arthrobacter oryzae]